MREFENRQTPVSRGGNFGKFVGLATQTILPEELVRQGLMPAQHEPNASAFVQFG